MNTVLCVYYAVWWNAAQLDTGDVLSSEVWWDHGPNFSGNEIPLHLSSNKD